MQDKSVSVLNYVTLSVYSMLLIQIWTVQLHFLVFTMAMEVCTKVSYVFNPTNVHILFCYMTLCPLSSL